jgi:hypothetical protein
VDHNVPATHLKSLAPKITRVVDHHEDESQYPPEAAVQIVLLGSCASLVTEAIAIASAGDGGEVLINRSTYQVKPFYLSIETVLPIKPFFLPFKFNLYRYIEESRRCS